MAPTYHFVCKLRFVHSKAFPPTSAYWNPDTLAGSLLPRYHRLHGYCLGTTLRLLPFFRSLYTKRKPTKKAGWMTARTRFLDESIRSAVADGAKQVVILGAGLDTRAGRMREVLEGVRVFEVDLPRAQKVKRRALHRAGLAEDWGSVFVPVDFRNADWTDALQKTGCDLDDVPTHVLWESVIYYLTDEEIAATLMAFRKLGVSLTFDMKSKENASDQAARQWERAAASVGEPIRSGIDFTRIAEWAASHGWDVTDALCTPEDINARFFPDPEPGQEPYKSSGLETIRPASSETKQTRS